MTSRPGNSFHIEFEHNTLYDVNTLTCSSRFKSDENITIHAVPRKHFLKKYFLLSAKFLEILEYVFPGV